MNGAILLSDRRRSGALLSSVCKEDRCEPIEDEIGHNMKLGYEVGMDLEDDARLQ